MNEQYVLGIDFGTESGRVMLVRAADGMESAWTVVPYPSGVIERRLPGGPPLGRDWALQDPRDYLAVLREGVAKVMRFSQIGPEMVVGIGIDFTACTMLPALADGRPLCTLPQYAANPHAWVKLWKHHASQPQADRINQAAADRLPEWLRVYGGKVSSEWFFSKVLQIVEEAPEIYAAAERLIEASDWIVWQMTGQERRNECVAGYKGMWIKGRGFPPQEFLNALDPRLADVGGKLARDYHPLGSCAGGLTEAMAAATGLRAGTPVAVGNVDAHAGVPGCGVTRPGALVMIMGTSICHMLLAEERKLAEGICGVIQDGIVPGLWGYEAGQAGGGDIYAWCFRTLSQTPESLTEEAGRLAPGQTGLVALDWWNGNRSVLVDAELSGVLAGATLATRPADIYRALVEATAFGTYTIIRAFEKEGLDIHDLVACGSLAQKSPLVMQVFADVTNRTIRLPRTLQASGLGAAMHGAVAAGVYRNIDEAARHMAGAQAGHYTPQPAAHAVYQRIYREYLALHDYFGRGVNDCLKRLRAIQADQSTSRIS
ncbi:MAG: ribulokinase [Candidatus Solibacter usitatus]|nr:ribulokinase [Candidatus Solibacter usitatus]